MNLRQASAVLILMAFSVTGQAQESEDIDSIVGVWRLDELTNYDADGTANRPFGDPPTGTFIYSPGGKLSIQIMKSPPSARYEGRASDEQQLAQARGYLAYFGTYDINYETMTVTHKVEGALDANYVNSNRERAVRIAGDTLEIDITAPDCRRAYRRLTRVEGFPEPQTDLGKMAGLNDPRHHKLSSSVVGRDFHLFVRLPEDYDPKGKSYPVVYLLDGDLTFPMLAAYDPYLSFFDETPDVVLVGIAYGTLSRAEGNRRTFDYTVLSPTREDTGGAPQYQAMLETEAIPLIESAYNVDPQRRVIYGQSLGGQFVLYTALTQPDLFWGHIASNPAIHNTPDYFVDPQFANLAPVGSRLFVVSGGDELQRYEAPMRDWRKHWNAATTKPWDLNTVILEGHSHVSMGPAAYRSGMAWLFSDDPSEAVSGLP